MNPSTLEKIWYSDNDWRSGLLQPLASLTGWVAKRRRHEALQRWADSPSPYPVPIVVVGNLTVGGTGKTPLVGHLVKQAIRTGLRVGVVSRGYGGIQSQWPRLVSQQSEPEVVGDEPLMLFNQTFVPIAVCADRPKAVEYLLATQELDLIISDDGLQHYAMWRDLEILVIDGQRQLGNQRMIPAGPLRESPDRLNQVDWIVERSNTAREGRFNFQVQAMVLRNLLSQQTLPLHGLAHLGMIDAVAGIGNPEGFFSQLEGAGYSINRIALPDHFDYKTSINDRLTGNVVLLTEKDAVKAGAIAGDNTWVVEAQVNAVGLVQHWREWCLRC